MEYESKKRIYEALEELNQNLANEEWEYVNEFGGAYAISNKGRLLSLPREVGHPKGICTLRPKLLSQVHDKKGYVEYQITYKSKHYSRKAHRLVAMAFIPNKDNKPYINHIDCDKTNNSVENLEWCTNKENIIHAYRNGLCKSRTILQYDLHGNLITEYASASEAQIKTGINRSSIHAVCKGRTKTCGGYLWKYKEAGNGTIINI